MNQHLSVNLSGHQPKTHLLMESLSRLQDLAAELRVIKSGTSVSLLSADEPVTEEASFWVACRQ